MSSFSQTVKKELCTIRLKSQKEKRAQLMALTHTAATLHIGRELRVEYGSEITEVGKLIAGLAGSQYDVQASAVRRATGRYAQTVISLSGAGVEALLSDAGLFRRSDDGLELVKEIPTAILESDSAKKAFLRGVFLGAGSLNHPKREYHLEMVLRHSSLADSICSLLFDFGLEGKQVPRKDSVVVYLKDGDRIADFLALLGASGSILSYEETRVEKELRNYINRANNCETANIGKTVNAASEQIAAIKRILGDPVLQKKMSPALRVTAEARMNYPDMSLHELSELLGIGRSGINHRLQRLIRLSEN